MLSKPSGRRGGGRSHHQRRRGDRDRQEPAAVHGPGELAAQNHPGGETGEPGPAGQLDDDPAPPGARSNQADRVGDEGEPGADQQPDRPGVGAEVDPGGVGERLVQQGHQGHRGQGPQPHQAEHPPSQQGPAGSHRQRPQDVELLLDRQRPQMAEQRRARHRLEVGRVAVDERPVGHVAEGGEDVATEPTHLVGHHHRGEGDHGEEQEDQCREETAGTPHPEPFHVEPAEAADVRHQQRGDEEAADHEEDVDPQEPGGEPADLEVVEDHGDHRHRPDAVEPGHHRQGASRLARGAGLVHAPHSRSNRENVHCFRGLGACSVRGRRAGVDQIRSKARFGGERPSGQG